MAPALVSHFLQQCECSASVVNSPLRKLLLSATMTFDPALLAALGLHRPLLFSVPSAQLSKDADSAFTIPQQLKEVRSTRAAEQPACMCVCTEQPACLGAKHTTRRTKFLICLLKVHLVKWNIARSISYRGHTQASCSVQTHMQAGCSVQTHMHTVFCCSKI